MDEEMKRKEELDRLRGETAHSEPEVKSDKDLKRVKRIKKTLIVMAVLVAIALGMNLYERWFGQDDVEELNVALEELEQAIFEEKNNDTVGGATPQETLDMFISAVEAGDYEMASKYFVLERQEEELESLNTSKKENIDNIMGMLKETDYSSGEFSEDEDS
ncbi:hypothetical protein ACFLY5_01075, partial [Patescibacteria group bacterium]